MSDWFAMLIFFYLFLCPGPGNSYMHLIPFIGFSAIALSKASVDSDQFKAVMQHTQHSHTHKHIVHLASTVACLLSIEHEYRIH